MSEWMDIPSLPVEQPERRIHLERYEYAAQALGGRRVLDCACGMGYGTDLLRLGGAQVMGVDKDPKAIELARQRYPESFYLVGDIYEVSLENIDAVVSFETLEHLDDPRSVLARIGESEVSEVIASVPIRPTVNVNHWHRTDFTPDSFRDLIGGVFKIVNERGQLWPDGEDMYLVLHGRR